jgi:hypothetical protein
MIFLEKIDFLAGKSETHVVIIGFKILFWRRERERERNLLGNIIF